MCGDAQGCMRQLADKQQLQGDGALDEHQTFCVSPAQTAEILSFIHKSCSNLFYCLTFGCCM